MPLFHCLYGKHDHNTMKLLLLVANLDGALVDRSFLLVTVYLLLRLEIEIRDGILK